MSSWWWSFNVSKGVGELETYGALGSAVAEDGSTLSNLGKDISGAINARIKGFSENVKNLEHKPPSIKNYWKNKNVYNNPKYFNQEIGAIKWPENDGFIGEINIKKLKPGDIFDRYGNEYGRYTSPEGTPFEQRSLPPGSKEDVYHKYEVIEEFEVETGKAGPWFDEPGGGQQYFSNKNIKELIKEGFIEEA